MTRTRVYLIEDHAFVLDAMRHALEQHADFEVVGSAADLAGAAAELLARAPDVVVLDHNLPGSTGVEIARWLRERVPHARCVLLSVHLSSELVRSAERAGIAGYVSKGSSSTAELATAIRLVARGETFYDRGATAARNARERPGDALTETERSVLRALVKQRASNHALAAALGVSDSTIATHLRNLYAKTRTHNRSALIAWGEQRGVF